MTVDVAGVGRRIEILQAGRALAALAVVAHHVGLAAASFKQDDMSLAEAGYLGVDFFFVLSGFIIFSTAAGKGAREYTWHRVRRVLLPYLPIGIGIAILYTLFPSVSAGDRDWSWLTTLTLAPVNPGPALSVAWTLQHEFLFYAIFALAYFSGRFLVVFALWTALIVVGAAAGSKSIAVSPLNLEFLMGMAAVYALRIERPLLPAIAGLLPIAAWVAFDAGRENSILIGLGLACQLPLLVGLERAGKLVAGPILRFLGDASYSLYLAHGIGISLAARLAAGLDLPWFLVACAAGGMGAGLGYYFAVERPILAFLPKSVPVRAAA